MRHPIPALVVLALLTFGAGDAAAAVCQTQPGQGAIDQYCEIVPSGAGDRPTRPSGGGDAPALSEEARRELAGAGTDGTIVQALAAASPAPRGAGSAGGAGAQPGDSATGSGGAGAAPGAGAGTGAGAGGASAGSGAERADTVAPGATSRGTFDALFGDPFGEAIGGAWILWVALGVTLVAATAAWRRRSQWS